MSIRGLWDEDGAGASIHVSSGKRFHIMQPRAEEIDINVIADSLSKLCRWTGQCDVFYSVAQHSMCVSKTLDWMGPRMAMLGLLHDAPEAYLGDVSRPLKIAIREVSDVYDKAEERLEVAIHKRFNIPLPNEGERMALKWADDVALAVEARDIVSGIKPWAMDLPDPTGHRLFPRWSRDKVPSHASMSRIFKVRFAALRVALLGYDVDYLPGEGEEN